MPPVAYEQQTFDRRNPLARFAHRSRMRKSRDLVAPYLTGTATLVDYGCGQGRYLSELAGYVFNGSPSEVSLLGYDPYMSAKFDGYTVVSDKSEISANSVDIVTCLEVCEHLTDDETTEFIDFVTTILKPLGRLLVTVPIEIGPVLLVKELSRMVLHRRRLQMPLAELLKGTFLGIPPTRAANRRTHHTGYDWRETKDTLERSLGLESIEFSPFPYRSWMGQSQVLMIFQKGR